MIGSLVKLTINNVQLYSYHGVSPEEQQLGGRYEIDVELYYDAASAIARDDLSHALNYADVIACIQDVANGKRRRLIETLASDLARSILERFPRVESVCVRVRKRTVPVSVMIDSVEVEWRAHRQS
jgi:dihydroneopterin aldolase